MHSTDGAAYYSGDGTLCSIMTSGGTASTLDASGSIFESFKVEGRAYGYIPVVYASLNDLYGLVDGMTGQHRPKFSVPRPWGGFVGRIVAATGRTEDPITIDKGYPIVDLSLREADPSVYGVISSPDPEESDRLIVNSLGEGGVWVRRPASGKVLPGDLICGSGEWGLGMVQSGHTVGAHTVAKAMAQVSEFDASCDGATGLLRPRDLAAMSFMDLFEVAKAFGLRVSLEATPDAVLARLLSEAGVDPLPGDRSGMVSAAVRAGIPHAATADTHATLTAKLTAYYATTPSTPVAFVPVIYLL